MQVHRRTAYPPRYFDFKELVYELDRDGFTEKTAWILLKMFQQPAPWTGRITAQYAVKNGVCGEKRFMLWRQSLVNTGWLEWNPPLKPDGTPDYTLHAPGSRLLPYLDIGIKKRNRLRIVSDKKLPRN